MYAQCADTDMNFTLTMTKKEYCAYIKAVEGLFAAEGNKEEYKPIYDLKDVLVIAKYNA